MDDDGFPGGVWFGGGLIATGKIGESVRAFKGAERFRSAGAIRAVTCDESTNVVARVNPSTATREPVVNLVPTTCSVNDVPPAFTVFGFNNVIVGVGWALVTVSGTVFDR